MKAVLSAHDLCAGYDGKTVVRNLNLEVFPGHVICLIGPNGAGKTTILRTLSGLLTPVSGDVRLNGETINAVKAAHKAKEIAVVLTEKTGISQTSAFDLAAMGRTPHTGFFGTLSCRDRRIVHEALGLVGAESLSERSFSSLSDGEKQKVMIARALSQEPRVIILDEPTSHLDIKHKVEVVRILSRLAQEKGMAVVLSLHDIDIALKCCQTLLLVKDRNIAACGSPETIIHENTIENLYGLSGATYDHTLGSLELRADAPSTPSDAALYVAAGGGTGIPVYRLLSRAGFHLATGILHRNDIDHRVARAMKLTIVDAGSFEPIGGAAVRAAQTLMNSARHIIDAGFPTGPHNRENIRLLQDAAAAGRRIHSLRPPAETEALYGADSGAVAALSLHNLQEAVSRER
ncbi:MAG: ABC transporter ATP-binding protein [Spirochaetaceae bacterium]|jgi:iron complex transport system ATP-binding protein|nr:ABC transporter ATP-binding protein [Spirochaetaceae bacterium]